MIGRVSGAGILSVRCVVAGRRVVCSVLSIGN